ncbi:MAG TPA: hypothetical protein VIU46_10925, partial [Gallionellaceae bacterium]
MKIILMVVGGVVAVIGGATLLGILWLTLEVRGRMAKRSEGEKVREVADWFGTTGLDEETERELPRYLRREFGESLFDEGALKAE